MRKLTALVLVLLLTVALSACQAQENNKAANALPRFGQSGDLQNAADKTTGADTVSAAVTGGDTVKTDATTTDPAPSTTPELITRDRAIELALNEVGLERSQVFDLEAELDRERVGVLWEVDFDTLQYEYSYDINAYDGTVVKTDRERND